MEKEPHIVDLRSRERGVTPGLVEPSGIVESREQVTWRAPEFVSGGSVRWIAVILLVGTGLFVWSLLTSNMLFALFVFLAAVSLVIWERRPPKEHEFKIDRDGVQAGEKFLPMDSLESFWVFRFPQLSILSVRPRSTFATHVRMPLPHAVEERAREALLAYLPEEEDHYSFVDLLTDRFHL
ncbi:MAG: hypothetical protein HYS57_02090 [Parcubacteria group bacterium]|nr:hypothetical protein [Parcubacteria group bacterium]